MAIRVLVVDRDPEILRGTCQALADSGYATTTASSAAEALTAIETESPDLVVLDRGLRGVDSLELCRQIKADPARADMFVVMTSSSLSADHDQVEVLTAGADGYVARTPGNRELLARVGALVRLVRMRRTLREQATRLELKYEELRGLTRDTETRAEDLRSANSVLVDSRRAALNLIDDAMDARRALEAANQELRAEVAERRRAEDSLRKVSMAAEQSPVSIIITDLAANIEYVNPHFTRATGYTLSEVTGKNPRILQSGETEPAIYRDLWAKITSGEVWEGEFHNKKKNGELFWEHAVISPVRDPSGRFTSFVAVKEDITNRRAVEQALRESEELHRLLADNASDVIWTMDPDGRFTYISPSIQKRRGYTAAEVMQQGYSKSLTPESAAIAMARFREARQEIDAGGPFTPFTLELEQPCKDGTLVWSEESISGLFSPDGRFVGALGVSRDLGERKRAQEKLAAQLDELLRWQAAMLGREGRVAELKREVNDLSRRLGLPVPYPSQDTAPTTAPDR
jgi:PAS domain S-box-containing protein